MTHRDIWLVEAKREAERLEDLEMEKEFKPLPPQGTEASSRGVSPSKGQEALKEGNLSGETFFPSASSNLPIGGIALSNAFCVHYALHFRELSAGWSDSLSK